MRGRIQRRDADDYAKAELFARGSWVVTITRRLGARPTTTDAPDAFYAGGIHGDGGLWSSYQADRAIFYGPDWHADVINSPASFLTDVAKGKLANITWITPIGKTSFHPMRSADT